MELEGLRIRENHPWGNYADVYVEEIQCLLNASTHSFNIDVGISCSSNRRTAGYDSMGNQMLTLLDGGR